MSPSIAFGEGWGSRGPRGGDAGVSAENAGKIRKVIEPDSDNRLADLHVWYIDRGIRSVALTIVTDFPKPSEHYRALLKELSEIKHSIIQIVRKNGDAGDPVKSA